MVRLDRDPGQVLTAGPTACLFGRGNQCQLRIGHRVPGGADRNISRVAGSIRWDSGWTVHNESTSRPFDIIVRGTHRHPEQLAPLSRPDVRPVALGDSVTTVITEPCK